jgi:branched-chain amino acid transport system permease protein
VLSYAVAGLAAGGSFALLGLALTITFRATRTVNFAAGAMGAVGTFTFSNLYAQNWPFPLALACGMAVGALLGLGMGFILVKWFDEARVETKSVVTIALFVSLLAFGGLVWGGKSQPVPLVLLNPAISIAETPVSQSTAIGLVLDLVLAVGITLALSKTLLGKRLQAVSERAHTAELLGIPSQRYGLWVWALSGAFSVIAIWLVSSTYSTEFSRISMAIVPALAAALFGLFKYPLWTVAGGIVLGISQAEMAGSDFALYSTTVPFFALLVVLLWTQRLERWEESR